MCDSTLSAQKISSFPGVIGTFMGRDAIRLAASALGLSSSDVALLPGYLCVEVLKPFLERCRVEFYDVRPDTSIDPQVLQQQLTRYHPKVVLFINYFGFLQPHRAEIKQLCAGHGALLIEDCAHSLLTEGSGDTGDWVIHSFRKILPLPDGGGLKANTRREVLHPRFRSRMCSDVLSVLIVLKSWLKVRHKAFSRAGVTASVRQGETTYHAPDDVPCLLPMSTLSQLRLRGLDSATIKAKRRRDFQFWLEWCAKFSGVTPLFDRLGHGVCPMGFPVIVRDREVLRSRLEREGLLIRTHWHLPPSVGSEFVHSHCLANETLTLPLYHEFADPQRSRIASLVA